GKLEYLQAAFKTYQPAEWRTRSLLLTLQFLPYLAVTLFMFLAHARKTKAATAAGRLNLLWLRTFIVMILIICGAGLFRVVFDFSAETMLLVPCCFSIMVYAAGYMALRHPEALTGRNESPPARKYEKSTLTPERAEAYLKKLLHVMEAENLYRDGDLTLQKLAERLSIPV